MKNVAVVSITVLLNLMSLPAFAQSYYSYTNDRPWQNRSSAPTRPGAVASSMNVYTAPNYSGAAACTGLLAGQSVNPAPIKSGKFNLGFGGQDTVVLPYTPGPDWAPVFNSHSGALMGYMAPGETLQQFFSGQSGHILPSQAAEGQWILQNQLGGMGDETAAQFSGF
jgi:hypothetical protein